MGNQINTNNFIAGLESYIIKDSDDMSIANEQMIIPKEALDTLWYEDKDGRKIPTNEVGEPLHPEDADKIAFQVSRFPLEIQTNYLKIINQKDVDECKHPEEHIVPTYGWVDGYEGRECRLCHGTQVKKVDEPWPNKWEGGGSRRFFTSTVNLGKSSEDLVLAMANSGEYRLHEAILIVSQACERCVNVLLHKYLPNIGDGYAEYSEEWLKCNTECRFCQHETVGAPAERRKNNRLTNKDNE